MAPSPTGNFHIGGVRTALFNYFYAKQHGGTFIIRSEDTDKERSKPEYEQNMLDVLKWLEIDFDAFYRQSERTEIYQDHIKILIDSGNAYEAEESNENPELKVIRFKNPNTIITFNDIILGDISFDTTELGDFVIARNITTPIYHLTVVVDDALMNVSHVIRGQEHINNTARQILILEAMGFTRPNYAHIPLIMSPRGGKLSKRDPEVIPTLEYKDQGILKDAFINFLSYIGWNPGDDVEIMKPEEILKAFSLDKVQKSGGVFNIEKLYWMNKQYLNMLSDEEFVNYLEPVKEDIEQLKGYNTEIFSRVTPVIRERIEAYKDIHEMIKQGDLEYYFNTPLIQNESLVWKQESLEDAMRHLKKVHHDLDSFEGTWDKETLKELLFPYAEEQGKGSVLWPLRYTLCGKEKSPDPFTLLEILGKEESLQRILKVIQK